MVCYFCFFFSLFLFRHGSHQRSEMDSFSRFFMIDSFFELFLSLPFSVIASFSLTLRAYCERVTSTEAATLAGLERPISSCRACSCMWVTCEASLSGFLFSFVCARTVTTHVMSRCYAVCFLIKENVSSMRLRSFCYFCWMCISVVLNT